MRHQFSELVTNQHILLTLLNKNIAIKVQQSIIKNSNKKIIDLISEILQNTLNGNIPLNKRKLENLVRYKTILRQLVRNKKNVNKKRKIILKILKVIKSVLKNFFSSSVWENIIQNVQ